MRECGECTLCCTCTRVPELNKAEKYPCKHCDSGCSIYENRPESCKKFRCRWLDDDMNEDMRPDKSHVVIEALPGVPVYLALTEPGYKMTQKITDVLKGYNRNGIAVVFERNALIPDGMTEMDVINYIKKASKTLGVI